MLLLLGLVLTPSAAAERASVCLSGSLPGGASFSIVAPDRWSARHDGLILFAPGYRFPDTAGSDAAGRRLPDLDPAALEALERLGLAIATLEYRKTGLAVKQGVEDVEELLGFFAADPLGCGYGRPEHAWLVGGSEGALVATLVAEREAARAEPIVDGVLAACGPIGDFRLQLDYIADFRIIFDVLFPGEIPGSAVLIPAEVSASWDSVYEPRIRALLAAHPVAVEQLLRVARAAWVPGDPASIETTVLTLLRYNVGATNDAVATLGGIPFDNSTRVYSGSGDPAVDALINSRAERVVAEPAALAELEAHYQTSGRLDQSASGGARVPLVSLHTTADPLVPQQHAEAYAARVRAAGSADDHYAVPIERYGHCAFTPAEVVGALIGVVVMGWR